jgi:tetratricopeptide (TPR) repeat protein
VIRTAQGYYQLKQYQLCVDELTAVLDQEPELPGARRLLGMALGHLDCPAEASGVLAGAVEEDPDDPLLRASLLSAQIEAGILPAYPVSPLPGAQAEFAGAAAWLHGQARLRQGRAADAARLFLEAASLFQSSSPQNEAGERIAACYVGLAISHLVAGQLEAAQQSFTRLGGHSFPEAALSLARQVYEVVEAVRELPPEERTLVLAPLAQLVLQARLRVRFYDQLHPPAMHWENFAK